MPGDGGRGRRERGDPTLVTVGVPVAREPAPGATRAMIVVLTGPAIGRSYEIGEGSLLIGRSGDVGVALLDEGVSRRHAEIERRADGFWITDLGSMNGTAIDDRPLAGPTRLADGARIRVGTRTLVKFSLMDSLEAEAQRRLSDAVFRDGLTGVYNRRYLDIRLGEELAFASRHGRPLSILMLDVDHFKRINDGHGHPAGDEILKALAQCLERNVRREDVVARYGGEEFVILGRGITLEQARAFGERVCAFVRALRVPCAGATVSLTVSIGCAVYRIDQDDSVEALLGRADAALYEAKQGGRNRVVGRG